MLPIKFELKRLLPGQKMAQRATIVVLAAQQGQHFVTRKVKSPTCMNRIEKFWHGLKALLDTHKRTCGIFEFPNRAAATAPQSRFWTPRKMLKSEGGPKKPVFWDFFRKYDIWRAGSNSYQRVTNWKTFGTPNISLGLRLHIDVGVGKKTDNPKSQIFSNLSGVQCQHEKR